MDDLADRRCLRCGTGETSRGYFAQRGPGDGGRSLAGAGGGRGEGEGGRGQGAGRQEGQEGQEGQQVAAGAGSISKVSDSIRLMFIDYSTLTASVIGHCGPKSG